VVDLPRERLERVELAPFRAATQAGLAMIMTAHVVYTALDDKPATLSAVAARELRSGIGFDGVLVSDDLEMRAIAARWSIEDAAVLAVAAGCDALLVCWSEALQEQAVAAVEREAEKSPAFRARCEQAQGRLRAIRQRIRARPLDDAGFARVIGGETSRAVAAELQRRLGA